MNPLKDIWVINTKYKRQADNLDFAMDQGKSGI
jgi:hypothetical protein